jgi:protein-disulfide isomerase
MRRITAALLLTTCLATAESLLAQNGEPAADLQQASTQQTSTEQTSSASSDTETQRSRYKARSEQDKNSAKAQAVQSNCAPEATNVSEGDPDAPQNRVEYGGGG